MRRKLFYLMIIISLLAISGCSSSVQSRDVEGDGLIVSSIIFGLGGDLDRTLVSYTASITNKSRKSAYIQAVEPILRDDLKSRIVESDLSVLLNKTIESGASQQVSGSFHLNTQGLDKQGIVELKIQLDEFKVVVEQVIGRNG